MPRRWLTPLALLLLLRAASPAAASEPLMRADLINGFARVTLSGSYVGARYSVARADGPTREYLPLGEQNALCTGDCYVVDPEALPGGTYWYRFQLLGTDGQLHTFGPQAVSIGEPAAGLRAAPTPNPIRDRGMLRVTAALATAARATDPGRATGLDGDVTLVDLSGRLLRTLWSGRFDRLVFDLPFEARDAHGRLLPAGLYLVVVRAGQYRSISRVAVVR